MGELKSCLFCGKNVDEAFQYCPHCGYEFGQGERTFAASSSEEIDAGELHRRPGDEDYLQRLRTLQEILSDMEQELDLIIRTSSKGP